MKPKTKFKVGDKVKILPSAVDIGVRKSEVGKIATISSISQCGILISDSKGREYADWSVNDYNIAPAVEVGQQLLLWEDMYA